MSSFRRRPATRADAAAVVAIVRALDETFVGASDYAQSDLDEEWRTLPPEENAWVVVDGEEIVAYGTVDDRASPPRADGYVAPAHFARGAGAFLVRALEDELIRRGARLVHNATLLADERAHELLRRQGYREIRRFWHMRIELTEPPAVPRWPPGVAVETLDPRHAEAFHAAYEDAFSDHWGHVRRPFEEWRRDHMQGADYAPELWRAVRADGELVAGAFGVWDRSGSADVSRLFTRREWRRRGLGEALLLDAFGAFWRGGRRVVGLGVDATSNTGANRLYERAGMHVHWGAVVFEKELLEPA